LFGVLNAQRKGDRQCRSLALWMQWEVEFSFCMTCVLWLGSPRCCKIAFQVEVAGVKDSSSTYQQGANSRTRQSTHVQLLLDRISYTTDSRNQPTDVSGMQ
jgi:hypothetical protein